MNIWYVFVTLAAVLALTGLLMRHVALRGLIYTRRFDRNTYFCG